MDTHATDALVNEFHTHLTGLLSAGVDALDDASISLPEGMALGWQTLALIRDFLQAARQLDGPQRRTLLQRLQHSRIVFEEARAI